MTKLSILIPSYKRVIVLDYTLSYLYNNIDSDEYEVNIAVGLNKAQASEEYIVNVYERKFKSKNIKFRSISYEKNIGKAKLLNVLYRVFGTKSDIVITMDNDIVILKPFLNYLKYCELVDYDIMGFSSKRYWAHNPCREVCPFICIKEHTFYTPINVGGGILLFHREFLEKYPFEDNGGVYGRVDLTMCQNTKKIYAFHIDDDIFLHDPLAKTTPELELYEQRKINLINKGITVFPEGWDE